MKNILNNIILLFTAASVLVACSKDDLTVLNPGTSTTLNLNVNEVVLDILNIGQDVLTVTWTEPEFGFDASVNYNIVFINGDQSVPVAVGDALSKTFESSELNDLLLKAGLEFDVATQISVKIEIVLSEYKKIDSEPVSLTATPYSINFDPIYMIGEAVKGWDTSKAVEVYGIGPGEYEVIAEFNNNGNFRFFDAADWGATGQYNWSFFEGGEVDDLFVNAEDGDTNLRFVGETGFYKIYVNLITKTIEMTPVDEPKHYMVGAGVPDAGWGWDTPVEMTWIKDGLFEATTTLSNDTFRFFTKAGDWGSGRNFPYYVAEDFEIDSNFEDGQDNDNNFRFIGEPGVYTITVDYNNKEITLSQD